MPVYSLDDIRKQRPDWQGYDDVALLQAYSQATRTDFAENADYFGVKPTGTLREMGRQFTGGLVSDLPRMVGQGLQYTDIAPELGREIAQAAEARAPQYAYDPRRGLGGEIFAKGARAVPPMLPALGAAFLPGGQFAAPVVAGGLFGTSSAQETLEKLRAQGISEEDAQAAAARVGLLQGPAEAVATATGLRVLRPLGTALRGAPRTTAGVAGALTDTRVLAPFARGMAINYPVQVGTEVVQDVGTSMIEEAYGAAPEDRLAIARESAVGAIGLTTLLGPLGLGASVSRARRAEQLRSALYDPNVTPEARLEARQAVVAAAQQQGVAAEDAEAWFARQYREDAAATLSLQEQEQAALERRKQDLIDSGATTQQAEELVQSESQDPEFWQRLSQSLQQTPTEAIRFALEDPEFAARISPEERDVLLNVNAALRSGRLPDATREQIAQQASEIIGRYQALGLPAGEQVDLTAGAAPAAPTVGLQPRVPALLGGTGRAVDLTTPPLPTRAPLPLPEGVTTVPGAPGVMEITPPAPPVEPAAPAVTEPAAPAVTEPAAPAVTEPAPAAPVTTFDLARPVDTKVTEKGLSTSVYKALDAQGQPVDITVRRTADGNISRISTQQRAGGGRITQDLPRSQYRAAGTDTEALNTLFSGKLTPVSSTGVPTPAPVSPPAAAQAPGAPFSAVATTEAAAPTPPAAPAIATAPAAKDPFSAAERAELDDTLSNLEATIASEPGAAAGRVTLPQSVLAGLSRMLRTTKNMPPIAYVPKTLSQVDTEATQTYAEQMTRVRDAANKVIDAARQLFNFEAASVPSEQKAALQRKGERLSDPEKDIRAANIAQDVVNTIQQRRQELRNAVEELRQAAGTDRNVEAVVAVAKGAIQKAQQKTQAEAKAKMEESRDALLSSAWARFKDGSLDAAEAADVVRGREIRRSQEAQEKGVKKPPLVDAATEGYARRPLPSVSRKGKTSTEYAAKLKESKAKWEASKEKGALGILAYIQRHGTGFERLIASAVGRALRNPKATAPSLQWIDADKTPYFDPATNTIGIHQTASPEQVLHETLHAALQWWVYNNPASAEVLKIEAALKRVLDFKGDMPAKAKQVTDLLRGIYGDGKTQQQKLNAVLELISYGTTLGDFRQFLKTLESDQTPSDGLMSGMRDLWKRITALVQKFLGVSNTVANDVLDGTVAMLESAATEADVAVQAGRTGGRLEAAITSDPVVQQTMKETGYTPAEFTAYASKLSKFKMPTQVAFELIGFGRDLQGRPLKASAAIEKGGAKAAAYIRKNLPSVERFILNFNSRFSNGASAADIDRLADNLKREFNAGYVDMEDVATIIDSNPDMATSFLDYMDGNNKALDNVPDAAKLKILAESVQGWFDRYIKSLPENSKEGRFFRDNKFSEYLLYASKVGDVAGATFSAAKVSDLLSLQKKTDPTIERSWLREKDGNILTDDKLYEVMQPDPTNPSKLVHAGFISQEVFNQTGVPKGGFTVDTGAVWRFSQFKEGAYEFQGNLTAREAVRRGEISKLTTAFKNTAAALGHTYASKNFLRGMDTLGYENGKPTAGSVAFSSLDDVNSVFGTRVAPENVLNVSDEATRSPRVRLALQRTGTWVKLPDGARYGDMAGKYVPGPVWNSMLDMMDRQPLITSRIFNNTMRFFKKSKTVYNPGTHVVNIGSNITLMYMHGIPMSSLKDAAKLLYKFEFKADTLTEQEKQMVMAFRASGSMIGQYTNTEVKRAIYDAIEDSITPASDSSTITKMNALAKFEKIKAGLSRFDDKVSELYAAEDNVFRLAAFLNFAGNAQVQAGTPGLTEQQLVDVGRATRKAFLDYDIDSRAIRAMRQSFFPFISWSYAVMPVLGRLALYKPWAMTNVLLAYMMLQAATEDDDDEARKAAPEYLRDRAYGVGPYMHMRIPFMGSDEEPVYVNLGKFNPLFTLFAPPPGEAKLAGQSWWPGFATPSGPMVSLLSGLFGYDPFTGKPMHAPTDTEWDKLVRTGKSIYDTMAPSAVNSRFFTNIGNLVDDRKGITGTEPDTLFLLRNLAGAPFYQFNVTESRAQQDLRVQSIKRDFNTAMNKAKREEMRKGYPDYEALDAELADLRKRMEAEVATARGEQPPEE